tara:strand:+ start:299 stop:2365 length:2067 start_codon:yes stop_codon:yes gene_type:complete
MSIKFAEFIQKRLLELGSLVIISISIGFFIFLLNYSPVAGEIAKQEYNFLIYYTKITGNFLSDFFLQSFGLAAFLFPVCIIIWGLRILFFKTLNNISLKILTLIASTIFLAVSISLYKHESFWLFYNGNGGFLGNVIKTEMVNYFSLLKSEYLAIITLLVSIFLFFFSSELKWKSIFLFISKFFNFFSKYKKIQDIKSENIIQNENSIIEKKQQDLPFKYTEEKNLFEKINFKLPSINFLEKNLESKLRSDNKNENSKNAEFLEKILLDFSVKGKIKGISHGPVVTLNEFEPSPGIKVSKIINLAEDIARNTSSVSARVSTIPGKNTVGIEIPNEKRDDVYLREIIEDKKFSSRDIKLPIALGKSISGIPIVGDLSAMPHLLIAGTTGSGKSVCINTIIVSLLYKHTPENCKFILIDPKMLELSSYEGIPHLLSPVITEPKKATAALSWVVKEMENRYRKMTEVGVRNIDGFNSKFKEKMPYIVVVVDEMSDLMLVAGKEIENYIQKLSQMARAAGIHIIMATQRPSVDVITGTIKANFPTRISFQVSSKIDSRTILGEQGAEQLLGKGDMLFMSSANRIIRIHGPYIGENEIEKINTFLRTQAKPNYLDEITNFSKDSDTINKIGDNDKDELYEKAVMLIKNEGKASTSFLQRKLQIGYNRAARIIDMMEEDGIVGQPNHVGKREVL